MRIPILIFLFCFSLNLSAQEDFLAKQYFSDGDFDKAVVFYEKLYKENPRRTDFHTNLVKCYQQLERYEDAEKLITEKLNSRLKHPVYFVDLGQNYTLQKKPEEAKTYYDAALKAISTNAAYGYSVGFRFQSYSLLDLASKAYTMAMQINPQYDYNYQLARIYGEQGDVEKMFESYLALIANGKTSKNTVLRNIDDFISEDAQAENNIKLKKILLRNAQKRPDLLWNEMLSWLFIQQKQYNSAFGQEKAIFKRSDQFSLTRLRTLGEVTLKAKENDIAQEIYEYIIENSEKGNTQLSASLALIELQLIDANAKKIAEAQKTYQELLDVYGYEAGSMQLQISYANFLTFTMNQPEEGINILQKSLKLPLNNFGKAYIKMALGDILVYDKKFNKALIYFSQIQKTLKNDILGQNARYKVAQTSFYKGDFDWALTQLKVLRSSTSQLIANDAMQLSLLISDNSLEDSTQVALKKYAVADLLAFQNKTKEAINTLDEILANHKGEKIEDEALLKQGKLLEKEKKYEAAELNYIKIVEFYGNGILADDAHFALGELYQNQLNNIEKAKYHFEKIIYNHQDSYYFPLARKQFRKLRGDAIN